MTQLTSEGVEPLPFGAIFDEYSSYMFPDAPGLTISYAQLRDVPGVPQELYRFTDEPELGELVFVFERLARSVCADGEAVKDGKIVDEERVRGHIPGAWISPLQAALEYQIIPDPYSIATVAGSGVWVIHHRQLYACIEETFPTKEAAYAAASKLWSSPLPGVLGTVLHKGQRLEMRDPEELMILPDRPDFTRLHQVDAEPLHLGRVENFAPGYGDITESYLGTLNALSKDWGTNASRSLRFAHDNLALAWSLPQLNDLGIFNGSPAPDFPEGMETVRQLRELYPELSALSDGDLYWSWDSTDIWPVERTDDFLIALLDYNGGIRVDIHTEFGQFGKIVLMYLLAGESLEDSLTLATAWRDYDSALKHRISRLSQAMRFLAGDNPRVNLIGYKALGLLEGMRSLNYRVIQATQDAVELGAVHEG
ncbi:hypothetical protein HNP46_006750 [Pseudomonas nitritireducens]|uniref:Uncharacterized protein n=1 Tax=Pseudomonas nitroreducens TaxID=46680 RepID=A0A7W7P4L6_PSENT|nr:hypothetical protein [Pseudomonas nitritireducens]MBB4867831.1 hypothetical protein [Pseudomonas nitritireducens]